MLKSDSQNPGLLGTQFSTRIERARGMYRNTDGWFGLFGSKFFATPNALRSSAQSYDMKKNLLFSLRSFAAILFCVLFAPFMLFAQGTWETKSEVGFARWAAMSGTVNGKIYVIGGLSKSSVISAVEMYDPASDSWTTPAVTGSFTPTRSAASAVVDGKIFVIGGNAGASTNAPITDEMYAFDPSVNKWEQPLTTGTFTARSSLTAAAIDGKIYVFGGGDASLVVLNTLEVFDPATNEWTTPTTTGTSTPRRQAASCLVNGKLYVLGGFDGTEVLNTVEVFDPVSNAWSTPTTTGTFTARRGLSTHFINGKIYAMGGYSGGVPPAPGTYLNTVEVFDPQANSWSTPLTTGTFTARYGQTSELVNGQLYVIGGQNTTGNSTNVHEAFTPAGSKVMSGEKLSDIALSPNPTTGLLTIHRIPENATSVVLSNVLGKTVFEQTQFQASDFTLDLSKLAAGSYFVRITSPGSVVTKMLVRE